jgi:hypothetical protein
MYVVCNTFILSDKTCSFALHIYVFFSCHVLSGEPVGKDVFVLLPVFSQDYALNSKEEVYGTDKVKEEVCETEITTEEHAVNLKSNGDIQRLVPIYNSGISLQ